ncbi:alpha-2,3-sialyltransferase, partial [Campylobacter jejuni]|nr:alpha-2,3-sialyltransferase [Campylobacter jejuni]
NLNQTIETKNKTIQDNLIQIQNLNQTIQDKDNLLSFQTQYGTAKQRIQNQLSYKLGQAMIVNSKSLLGYIRMPF